MAEQTTTAKPQRRRRSDADRSVQAILEAALDALAGDPDASMAEIARRAGVVRATIYAHFPTRESLLDDVMEHAVADVAGGAGGGGWAGRGGGGGAGPGGAERGARASPARHLDETQQLPRVAGDQHSSPL